MDDQFLGPDNVSAPARRMWVITPHDTNEVNPLPKAIRADDAGVIVLRAVGSDSDVTINVVAGEIISVRVQHIRSTGTTVTVIHGLS